MAQEEKPFVLLPWDALLVPGDYNCFQHEDFWRNPHKKIAELSPSNLVDLRFVNGEHVARVASASFSPDFGLMLYDSLRTDHVFNFSLRGEGWILFCFRLTGKSKVLFDGVESFHHSLSCHVMDLRDFSEHCYSFMPEEPLVQVNVAVKPSYLLDHLRLSGKELSKYLGFGGHEGTGSVVAQIPLSIEMERIVRSLQVLRSSPGYYRLIMESKALELIFLYFQSIDDFRICGHKEEYNENDVSRLQEARAYLRERYISPPTIEELARKIGVNRNKLTRDFKAYFGKSIYQYVLEQRMEMAKVLLKRKVGNVQHISEEVGYSCQGNFTKAFKKYTGVTPKAFLKS